MDDNRLCPGCKQDKGQVMHAEKIACPHCNDEILMEYLSCECRYSWREINGIFLDGGRIEVDGLEGLLQGITDFIEAYAEEEVPASTNMSSMIHHCLKCNSLASMIHVNPDVYRCTVCEFEWEVEKV